MATQKAIAEAQAIVDQARDLVRDGSMPMMGVCRQAGLSASVGIYRWHYNRGNSPKIGPSLLNVASVLDVMGYTLQIVPKNEAPE